MNKPQLSIGSKPANAGYRAKATLFPDGVVEVVPDPTFNQMNHDLEMVQINWYDDKVRIKFLGGAPALISQAYLTGKGKDVILEIKPEH